MTFTFKCRECGHVLKEFDVSPDGRYYRMAFAQVETYIEDILAKEVSCEKCGREFAFVDLQQQDFESMPNVSWSQ